MKRLMPENVGTNALIRKVLVVSNAHAPIFPLLIPLGNSFFFFFEENNLPSNINGILVK